MDDASARATRDNRRRDGPNWPPEGGPGPYRSLFDAINHGFFVIDLMFNDAGQPTDFRFVDVNPAFEQQSGLSGAVGNTARELMPELESSWFQRYGRIAKSGKAEQFTARSATLNRWFDVTAFPIGGSQVAVLFTDVTAQREAERALRESENLLRVALNAAHMGAWSYDPRTGATQQSARYQELFGRAPDDTAATIDDVYSRIHPDDRDEVRARIAAALRGEQPYRIEYRVARPDGRVVWIHSEGEVTRNAAGDAVRVSGVMYDVTERREHEEALKEADRRKNEFLAVLAHEMRNPLAPIRNSLEIMKRTTGEPDTLRMLHGTMERQLGQMIRLVDDLLDVSRISHGRIALQLARVDVAKVLLSAVESSRPLIEASRHQMHVTLPPEPIWVTGDAARLAQVFLNLLNNGAKYTAPGGSIWLSAERRDGHAVVRVRDSGMGIAENQLDTIFDMFAQIHPSAERSQGGLGIGLTLVRRLVELHGGTVSARSPGPMQGSEFEVSLPIAAVDGVADVTTSEPDDLLPAHSRRRILVVDDSRDGAESLAALLTMTGHDVAIAHDGMAALSMFSEFHPDVVLMDLGMPRMNGLDAAARMRQLRSERRVTLVALTGWGQDADRRSTAAAGFDAHLTKPVDFAALKAVLARR